MRVGKLNQHTGKAVDMRNSIDCLLTEAEKLCDPKGFTFETFKKKYAPSLGSRRA